MRILLVFSGGLSLLLGVIGLFLPLLPTTPFVLLSALCFSKSSDRFHTWLLSHPLFGNMIDDWQTHRSISRKAKISAMFVIVASIGLSWVMQIPTYAFVIQVSVLTCVTTFLLTRPERGASNTLR